MTVCINFTWSLFDLKSVYYVFENNNHPTAVRSRDVSYVLGCTSILIERVVAYISEGSYGKGNQKF